MLEIRNITIQTHRGRTLINNLSFVLNKNDKIAIIGEEGNGKSTLLKAIINPNLIQDYVSIQGDINKNGYQCGYLSQTLDLSWNDTELFEFIVKKKPSEGLDPSYYNDISKVVECLSKVDFDSSLLFENRLMESFSGGEKVKIQLAKILYEQPDILLLDEPTNDLDLKTLIWLEEFIKEIDRPVLFITHDEVLLENTASGILHLEQLKRKTSPV
ncbi:MAG: ATP-binding cassette domain-containing protein [Anaerorhabdus sp.]|uniref:ATP-binding cassette domain-containing protein n=1 Tax=Anaerorhabdus sp. TaxID=1872524 RepID=UPI003A8A4CEE